MRQLLPCALRRGSDTAGAEGPGTSGVRSRFSLYLLLTCICTCTCNLQNSCKTCALAQINYLFSPQSCLDSGVC